MRREDAPHLLLGLEVTFDPRVSALDRVEVGLFSERSVEDLRVRGEFLVCEIADELLAHVGLEGVHHQAGVRQSRSCAGVLLDDGGLPSGVEFLEDVGAERGSDLGVLALELRHLRNVVVPVEVRAELIDSLEEVCAVVVLTAHRHRLELVHGGHEHAETTERGDGAGQVALRAVQLLDVAANLLHHRLAQLRLVLDVADARAELENRRLRLRQIRLGAYAAGALRPDRLEDLVVHATNPKPELGDQRVHARQRRLVGEEPIEEVHGVELRRREDVARRGRRAGIVHGYGALGRTRTRRRNVTDRVRHAPPPRRRGRCLSRSREAPAAPSRDLVVDDDDHEHDDTPEIRFRVQRTRESVCSARSRLDFHPSLLVCLLLLPLFRRLSRRVRP